TGRCASERNAAARLLRSRPHLARPAKPRAIDNASAAADPAELPAIYGKDQTCGGVPKPGPRAECPNIRWAPAQGKPGSPWLHMVSRELPPAVVCERVHRADGESDQAFSGGDGGRQTAGAILDSTDRAVRHAAHVPRRATGVHDRFPDA